MCHVSVNTEIACVQQCFKIAQTVTLTCTKWGIMTGQVKIRMQTPTLFKQQGKKKIKSEYFKTQNTRHSPHTTCLTQAYKFEAHVFHYPKDRKKIKKRKPHKKEKQNDSDVLVYTRYGNTYKLSKLWSEKSCYQATVKRVL